jgi:hypothetical protein
MPIFVFFKKVNRNIKITTVTARIKIFLKENAALPPMDPNGINSGNGCGFLPLGKKRPTPSLITIPSAMVLNNGIKGGASSNGLIENRYVRSPKIAHKTHEMTNNKRIITTSGRLIKPVVAIIMYAPIKANAPKIAISPEQNTTTSSTPKKSEKPIATRV